MNDAEAARKNREAAISAAWLALEMSESFKTVWELDLQRKFNPFRPSFIEGDEANTHAAAIRDGEKRVIAHIAKRLSVSIALNDEDVKSRPIESVSEFQG